MRASAPGHPRLLLAIAAQESILETYGPAQLIHNPFGLGPGMAFGSEGAAIAYAAQSLGANYLAAGLTTIPQIAGKWAPPGARNYPSGRNQLARRREPEHLPGARRQPVGAGGPDEPDDRVRYVGRRRRHLDDRGPADHDQAPWDGDGDLHPGTGRSRRDARSPNSTSPTGRTTGRASGPSTSACRSARRSTPRSPARSSPCTPARPDALQASASASIRDVGWPPTTRTSAKSTSHQVRAWWRVNCSAPPARPTASRTCTSPSAAATPSAACQTA